MKVSVLYFGILRELYGGPAAPVELPEGARVDDLLERLRGLEPHARRSLAVAVNRVYTQADHILRDGDEVALLPPVSGGNGAR